MDRSVRDQCTSLPAAAQLTASIPVTGPGGSGLVAPSTGLATAIFVSGSSNSSGMSGAYLSVVSGADLYTFVVANAPANAQDLLTGLAQAVLANPQQ